MHANVRLEVLAHSLLHPHRHTDMSRKIRICTAMQPAITYLLALNLRGTYCHKTGTKPPSCKHLDNWLYIPSKGSMICCWKTPMPACNRIKNIKPKLISLVHKLYLDFQKHWVNLAFFKLKQTTHGNIFVGQVWHLKP